MKWNTIVEMQLVKDDLPAETITRGLRPIAQRKQDDAEMHKR
jgi:hypothetical protein